jgi:(E)-4-hydroxy-3-methyl-but-2-enyl pyrophosphate reductase
MGVKRAVDMVLDIARRKGRESVYTYGPLIHNPQTMALLEKRGIVPVARLEDVPAGAAGTTLIIRAHGISPAERKLIRARGMRIVDATCPKVARVQAIIRKHARQDYTVVIVGDGDHPEVNGLLGYAEGKGVVIGSPEEIGALPVAAKVCVVAQTTQNGGDYAFIADAIRARFPDTIVYDTICDSTETRQAEVRTLAIETDAVVIVGGRNSANTGRLAGIAERQGTPTFRIETAADLASAPIEAFDRVGISAGASTPNWIIDRVVDTIVSRQEGKRGRFRMLYRLWEYAVISDVYSAIGAGCLCLAASLLQDLPVNPLSIATAALYVFAMHTLNRFLDRKTSSLIGSFREDSYRKHETRYIACALISLFVALALTAQLGRAPFLLLLAVSILGILYNTRTFPEGWRFHMLKDIPGSKNIAMALAWAVVAAILPWLEFADSLPPATGVAFLFTFNTVFIRSAMSDTLDIQSDRFLGRETIPVLIGEEVTRVFLIGVSVATFALLVLSTLLEWTGSLSFFLLAGVIYLWLCFGICGRRPTFSGVVREGLWETTYLIAGVSSLVWLWLA